MALQLTDQQQLVVNHDHGPALVFAVAGAGKTTAMVHRIERLVREGVFPAEKILATSFGRANVHDLRRELSHVLDLKVVPQLHFEYDTSVERGVALSRLIEASLSREKDRNDH